ncbi:hypothetical protein ACQKQD_24085 [Methylobacterium sp. NPDC080182]|uniref:hypothetical protein n=1 Tax=Methylobacterium sp. NPDC080182 TaxID=3390590 RepID=UPI003CFBD3F4
MIMALSGTPACVRTAGAVTAIILASTLVANADQLAAAAASPTWVTPLVTAVSGLLGVFIGAIFATRNSKAALVQKTNELEIDSIDKRLGDFVGPFELLSAENLKVAQELKRKHGGDTFRTLPALLDPSWKPSLTAGDRALLEALIENGTALRKLILDHGGAVSPALRPHMAAASMHFRMLALAHAGSLDNDPGRYASYVFPRQFDDVLALERRRLEARREILRSQPDTAHPGMADLIVPTNLQMPEA